MNRIHDDLLSVIDAVQIDSPSRYVVRAEPRSVAGADEADLETPTRPVPIIPALAADLYERLYTRPSPMPHVLFDVLRGETLWLSYRRRTPAAAIGNPDGELPRRRATRLPPRRVELSSGSRVGACERRAMRSDREKRAACWLPTSCASESRGSTWPSAMAKTASGDDGEDVGPTLRFYWHLKPEAAVPLMAMATALLNEAAVPFRLKLLNDPGAYCRADAGVLYVQGRDLTTISSLVFPNPCGRRRSAPSRRASLHEKAGQRVGVCRRRRPLGELRRTSLPTGRGGVVAIVRAR